jgi:cell division protease FtsH
VRRWVHMPDHDAERKGRREGAPTPRPRTTPWIVIGLVVAGLILMNGLFSNVGREPIDLSRFVQLVEQGRIPGTVSISGTEVSGTYVDNGQERDFSATLPPDYDTSTLTEMLQESGVPFRGVQPNPFVSVLLSILPLLLLMGLIYYFLFRRMGAGGANPLAMGKNKVKIYDRKEMKTNFSDVAGVDEAKDELKEIVEFLRNPKKYQRLGGRIPKGVLLLGPPGCGKTLLARAVAGEANVPFFFMSGSEFVEMFVGLGAARVRELFQQAKEKAPALVFLDEIDTIGKGRGGAMGAGFGAHDEREQTLNQLLVEMDGFDSSKGVIIMAATNRPDVLDQALVRPGRFDRQVVVDRPDLKGREEILRVHARGVALDPNVDLNTIAARTPGFTGADLENVVNEAALLAARRDKNAVMIDELEEAIDRASMGLERKSRVMSEKEKVRVAAHEMGHALVAAFCENLDPVHRVTIIPRGTAALGLTMTRPLEDRYLATEPELKDMLAFAMGGRVAEELVFGEVSTGAQNDLEKATQIARAMVAEYGMSAEVGPLSLGREDPNQMFAAPKIAGGTAEKIDAEVLRLLNSAHDQADRILREHRDLLDHLRDLLLAIETIDGADLEAYAAGTKPVPNPQVAKDELERRTAASVAKEPEAPPSPAPQPVADRPSPITLPPVPPMPAD